MTALTPKLCATCQQLVLTGTTDQPSCNINVVLDAAPLDPLGEIQARLAGQYVIETRQTSKHTPPRNHPRTVAQAGTPAQGVLLAQHNPNCRGTRPIAPPTPTAAASAPPAMQCDSVTGKPLGDILFIPDDPGPPPF